MNKTQQALGNLLEKGGKKAVIGEIRNFAGRPHIKTADGWKFYGKGSGAKAKSHSESHKPTKTPEKSIAELSGISQKEFDKMHPKTQEELTKIAQKNGDKLRPIVKKTLESTSRPQEGVNWFSGARESTMAGGSNQIGPTRGRVVENSYGTWHYNSNGEPHTDGDEPAVVESDGTKRWYKDGKEHRDGDRPAIVRPDGRKSWYKEGKLHRDGDKPARIRVDGSKQYFKNGQEYTPDAEISGLPIYGTGKRRDHAHIVENFASKGYYNDQGQLHRDGDEPALIESDGTKTYYKNGIKYTPDISNRKNEFMQVGGLSEKQYNTIMESLPMPAKREVVNSDAPVGKLVRAGLLEYDGRKRELRLPR